MRRITKRRMVQGVHHTLDCLSGVGRLLNATLGSLTREVHRLFVRDVGRCRRIVARARGVGLSTVEGVVMVAVWHPWSRVGLVLSRVGLVLLLLEGVGACVVTLWTQPATNDECYMPKTCAANRHFPSNQQETRGGTGHINW